MKLKNEKPRLNIFYLYLICNYKWMQLYMKSEQMTNNTSLKMQCMFAVRNVTKTLWKYSVQAYMYGKIDTHILLVKKKLLINKLNPDRNINNYSHGQQNVMPFSVVITSYGSCVSRLGSKQHSIACAQKFSKLMKWLI